MPELQDTPFEQGYNAYKSSKSVHYNPYRNTDDKSVEFCEWVKGWEAAAKEITR